MAYIEAPDEGKPKFVDAARIWSVLDGVRAAPNLYDAAADKFPDPPDGQPTGHTLDQEAFALLAQDGFVELPVEVRNDIERFRQLDRDGDRTRDELTNLYRRLRTLAVQHRKAEKDVEQSGGFLRSKSAQWESKQRLGNLEHEIGEATLKRRRLESDLEKCGTLLRTLLDLVYRDQVLRDARWYAELPVILTPHGEFLHDFLAEMNPANFQGRTLAEILEIGASLA